MTETDHSSAIKSQEFPLLKVPAETLNRKLRRGQKYIEKEASGINSFCKDSQWAGLSDQDARSKLKARRVLTFSLINVLLRKSRIIWTRSSGVAFYLKKALF